MEMFLLIGIKEHLAKTVLLTKNKGGESFYRTFCFPTSVETKYKQSGPVETGSGTTEMVGRKPLPNTFSESHYRVTTESQPL